MLCKHVMIDEAVTMIDEAVTQAGRVCRPDAAAAARSASSRSSAAAVEQPPAWCKNFVSALDMQRQMHNDSWTLQLHLTACDDFAGDLEQLAAYTAQWLLPHVRPAEFNQFQDDNLAVSGQLHNATDQRMRLAIGQAVNRLALGGDSAAPLRGGHEPAGHAEKPSGSLAVFRVLCTAWRASCVVLAGLGVVWCVMKRLSCRATDCYSTHQAHPLRQPRCWQGLCRHAEAASPRTLSLPPHPTNRLPVNNTHHTPRHSSSPGSLSIAVSGGFLSLLWQLWPLLSKWATECGLNGRRPQMAARLQRRRQQQAAQAAALGQEGGKLLQQQQQQHCAMLQQRLGVFLAWLCRLPALFYSCLLFMVFAWCLQ
jgi:hypothetical protein